MLSNSETKAFIHQWLKMDEDLVQGRETLAETVGLWMFYALGEDDQALFDEAYDQLEEYFLENDGFVN